MIDIRPAYRHELDDVLRQWVSSFMPGGTVSVGSVLRSVSPKLWKRSHRMLVQALLVESECHVLVVEDVPSEPLGWVVFGDGDLHYVYVIEKARRCGLGRKLLEHARKFGATSPSHLTAGGRELLEAGQHEQEEAETEAASGVLSGC